MVILFFSYATIHENLLDERKKDILVADGKMKNYLKKINVHMNYKTFINLSH